MGASWRLANRFGDLAAGLAALGEEAQVVTLEDAGRCVACGVRAVKPVWWCGRPARVGWLALLRRDPAVGRIAGLRALPGVYQALSGLRRPDELDFDLSAILAGNTAAQRLLTRGLRGLPAYRERSRYHTALWSVRAVARRSAGVRMATVADLPVLRGLSAPPSWAVMWPRPTWEASDLDGLLVAEQAGRVVACARLDDQSNRRGSVLLSMPPLFAALRPMANTWRRFRCLPSIPRIGELIALLYMQRWFWAVGHADSALEVLSHLASDADPAAIIVAGWPAGHPDAARLSAQRHEVLDAHWYSVGGPSDAPAGGWHLEAGSL